MLTHKPTTPLYRQDGVAGPPPRLDAALAARPKAIVIGSGFGGLACAVRLGAKGYDVTVLEQLDGPGGRGYVHHQDGFRFDAGPTIVTAPDLFEELWGLCGRRLADDVTLVPLDPFYKIRFDDGTVFNYSGDAEAMRREVARFNPDDVAGFDRFMARAKRQFDIGFHDYGHRPFDRVSAMAAALPTILRLGGHRSVYNQVCRHFKDPHLRVAFSFHPLLIGGNPMAVSAMYSLINHLEQKGGVHYAMGGTGSLARGLVGLIEGQGNRVRYNARVDRILIKNDRAVGVRLDGGETVPAQIVISNADMAHTYKHLLGYRPRRVWTDGRLARSQYSMSVFLWHFGTSRRFADVDHHTMVLGPRYEGLLRDIFHRKVLAEDFSLYLHRPTATDPAMAPPGCDAFYALVPVPHLDSSTRWDWIADGFRKAVQDRLEETVLPGLSDCVVTSKVTTPLDFKTRLLSEKGAAFGLEPLLLQSAYFRPHNRSEEVDGLFLAGASTHPGAGLPGVLSTAKIVDSQIPEAAHVA